MTSAPSRMFPNLDGRAGPSVPWALIAPHERQAQRNHSQSLERLAERGGLASCEMLAVLEDRPGRKMPDAEQRLREWLASSQEAEIARLKSALTAREEAVAALVVAARAAVKGHKDAVEEIRTLMPGYEPGEDAVREINALDAALTDLAVMEDGA